jgi:hypothetical protein
MKPKSEKEKKSIATAWRKAIQGQWMVQYVPFLLFLAFLAVLYIGNGHFADNTIRRTAEANRQLKQLQYEYKTLKAEVMYRSKESELTKAVEPLGLLKNTQPPIILKADEQAKPKQP